MSRIYRAVGFMILAAGLSRGQSLGSLRGVVSDSSGALVPDVEVTCTNTATGARLLSRTTGEGQFTFPNLPIGSYDVTTSKAGFEQEVRRGINVHTGTTAELGISLKVGAVGSVVEVNADASLIQTTTSVIQNSVTQKQMQDLPLNGRNALQLVVLNAGAVYSTVAESAWKGQTDNNWVSVNGLKATQNNFTLDGSNYTNRFFGTAPTLPNPDTLEEFTVNSANFSAALAGPGATVLLASRSGTNLFHGTAFEFLRNTDLDARNFFQLSRPPFKLNQYGGTFGGPIRKDRTFFFYSFQGTQQRSAPSSASLTTPTQAERNGDFSALLPAHIIDPMTGQPFPGNIIPPYRLDSLAGKLLSMFSPLPNRGSQYIANLNANVDDGQQLIKIDHIFSEKNHVFGRVFHDNYDFQRQTTTVPTPNFYAENYFHNDSITVQDISVFSPTLTATYGVSYSRYYRNQIPNIPNGATLSGLGAQFPLAGSYPGLPPFLILARPYFDMYTGIALQQSPSTFEGEAGLTKALGSHQVQFGARVFRDRTIYNGSGFTSGYTVFNGSISGNILSDFVLGLPASINQSTPSFQDQRALNFSLYINDDWRISRKLTMNVGVRWDPWHPATENNSSYVGFEPGVQSIVAPNAPRGLVYPGDPGISKSIFKNDWTNFAPRLGLAYDLFGDGKTVVRAAYGIFYNLPGTVVTSTAVGQAPYGASLTTIDPPSFENPYANRPGGSPFPVTLVKPSGYSTASFVLPVSAYAIDPSARTGYTQERNLTVEHQFKGDLALTVSYIGNHSVKDLVDHLINPALLAPGATLANVNSRRLYPGIASLALITPYGWSNYNGLQVKVVKRARKGLTLFANYTYSKSMDNISTATDTGNNSNPRDPFNVNLNKGPSDFDVTHRAVITAVYDFPKVASDSSYLRFLVNDWQMNTIVNIASGMPFFILSGTDRSLSGIGFDTADVVGNPARPAGANQVTEYFNTAAFVPAALGTHGTEGRNNLRGPGLATVDLSMFKNFSFTERFHLQFRAECFNIENRPNFLNPGNSLAAPATFGVITGASDPRVFQFGLKFLF